jgi:hypothetical protein
VVSWSPQEVARRRRKLVIMTEGGEEADPTERVVGMENCRRCGVRRHGKLRRIGYGPISSSYPLVLSNSNTGHMDTQRQKCTHFGAFASFISYSRCFLFLENISVVACTSEHRNLLISPLFLFLLVLLSFRSTFTTSSVYLYTGNTCR